jgi:hypothetical protein
LLFFSETWQKIVILNVDPRPPQPRTRARRSFRCSFLRSGKRSPDFRPWRRETARCRDAIPPDIWVRFFVKKIVQNSRTFHLGKIFSKIFILKKFVQIFFIYFHSNLGRHIPFHSTTPRRQPIMFTFMKTGVCQLFHFSKLVSKLASTLELKLA